MKDFAGVEWRRAERALGSAAKLVDTDPDSAASRAYYAAFHALTAFFAGQGRSFFKHTEIRAALHRDLVRENVLRQELAKHYDFLMDLRETGDYGGMAQVSPEDAIVAVKKSRASMGGLVKARSDLPH